MKFGVRSLAPCCLLWWIWSYPVFSLWNNACSPTTLECMRVWYLAKFPLMTLVLVLILNPLLDFFLYIKLMCPYFILLIYTDGERDGLWMACPFRTLVVLYRMFPFIICLILMNYLMEFYFIGFVNAHLPGCFCPWTFRLNIGLNTSPSDSFVSYLNSHLGYSAGEFQALQLIVLAVFGAVD